MPENLAILVVHPGQRILVEAAAPEPDPIPVETLIAIAISLADVDPRYYVDDDDLAPGEDPDTVGCHVCKARLGIDGADGGAEVDAHDLDRHADSCPWAAAVRWREEMDR